MAEKLTVYTLDEVAERLTRRIERVRHDFADEHEVTEDASLYALGQIHAYEVVRAEITALIDSARRNAADDIESGNVWPVEA